MLFGPSTIFKSYFLLEHLFPLHLKAHIKISFNLLSSFFPIFPELNQKKNQQIELDYKSKRRMLKLE